MPGLINRLFILSLYLLTPLLLGWWYTESTQPWYARHLLWLIIIAASFLLVNRGLDYDN